MIKDKYWKSKVRQIDAEKAPTIFIEHVSIFGGTEIK